MNKKLDKEQQSDKQLEKNLREELLEKFDVKPEFVDLVKEIMDENDELLKRLSKM